MLLASPKITKMVRCNKIVNKHNLYIHAFLPLKSGTSADTQLLTTECFVMSDESLVVIEELLNLPQMFTLDKHKEV